MTWRPRHGYSRPNSDAKLRDHPDQIRDAPLASLQERLAAETDSLKRVELHQSRIEIEEALSATEESADLNKMEAAFVEVASAYSDRKGISYDAWRSSGVSAAVLKKAGVPRTRQV